MAGWGVIRTQEAGKIGLSGMNSVAPRCSLVPSLEGVMASTRCGEIGNLGNGDSAKIPRPTNGRLTDIREEEYRDGAGGEAPGSPPQEAAMTPEQAARLQAIYEDALRQLGNDDPELGQPLREQLRLQVEYPNEYVAFRDEWIEAGQGETRRLIRHVIGHGKDFCQVYNDARQGGQLDDPQVMILYFEEG